MDPTFPFWPIADLTTTTPTNVAILGKVTHLWPLTTFQRGGAARYYINFVLKDVSGSIKVSLYGYSAYYAARFLTEDMAVRVRNFAVRTTAGPGAREHVSSIFETFVSEVTDPEFLAALDFPTYTKIRDTCLLTEGTCADILAIVSSVRELQTRTRRNTTAQFRNIYLYDGSRAMVKAILCGDWANFSVTVGSIVSVKNAKINLFEGINLVIGPLASFTVNPVSAPSRDLRNWQRLENSQAPLTQLSANPEVSFACDNLKQVITGAHFPQMSYVTARVRLMSIKGLPNDFSRHFYFGCQNQDCSTQQVTAADGRFFCPRCRKSYGTFAYRMRLRVQLVDHSAIISSTLFTNHLDQIFPFSMHTLYLMSRFDQTLYNLVLQSYLLEKDFEAKFKLSTGAENLTWDVLSLDPLPKQLN